MSGEPAVLVINVRLRYDAKKKEAAMIELTEQQMQALDKGLREQEYDDSRWTREELQALAWERLKHEDCGEYDQLPEKS
jgi:hypothetical protein